MKNKFAAACSGRRRAALCFAVLASGAAGQAVAQADPRTLDGQYEFHLAHSTERCQNLGFERDDFGELVPGQAGPQLSGYCSGPPPVGGGSAPPNASGGGTGAALGRGNGATEDAALRRRRDGIRDDGKDAASVSATADATGGDMDLGHSGNASAFLSFDYERARQQRTHFEAGQRSDLFGATLGADYRFGTTGVAGAAIRYGELSGDFAGEGGDFRSRNRGVSLYGSWFPGRGLFVDATAGVDRKRMDTTRIVSLRKTVLGAPGGPPNVFFDPPPAPVASDTDARESSAEIRAGYDFFAGVVTVGPRASLAMRRTEVDAFVERGNTPMALAFDSQTQDSLRTALGVQGSRAFNVAGGVIVSQLNLDWVHEFEDDQRVVTAYFAEDLRPNRSQLRFLNEAPDRDAFITRLSAVAVFPHGVSAFGSVQGLFGHEYLDRYGASVGLRVEF